MYCMQAKDIFRKIILFIITIEAKLILKKYKPKIVAVAGSVGKTSTKDAVYTALSSTFHTRKSEKSFNSDFGVPLTILGVGNGWYDPMVWIKNILIGLNLLVFKEKYPEWLVLEIGADRPGDIASLMAWIQPHISVLTRFPEVPVHVEFFSSPEELYKEDFLIADALPADGVLVINDDDERQRTYELKSPASTITYGFSQDAEVRGSGVQFRYTDKQVRGVAFRIRESDHKAEVIELDGSLGVQHAYPVLAAFAVGKTLAIPFDTLQQAFATYDPPRGRMRLIKGIKHSIIIDDTYNSSPIAVAHALTALHDVVAKGKKIAILGDMLELGEYSTEAHKEVGRQVAGVVDELYTVGIRARMIATSAHESGLATEHIHAFDDATTCANALEPFLAEGDVVLIKGSQSIRLEKAVEELMQEPEKKTELLVRQDSAWLDK